LKIGIKHSKGGQDFITYQKEINKKNSFRRNRITILFSRQELIAAGLKEDLM